MKNKNNTFLFTVKDYLTSGDSFNLYWDNQKKRAWTDLGETKDLNHYYSSDQYIPHQAENKSLINMQIKHIIINGGILCRQKIKQKQLLPQGEVF